MPELHRGAFLPPPYILGSQKTAYILGLSFNRLQTLELSNKKIKLLRFLTTVKSINLV